MAWEISSLVFITNGPTAERDIQKVLGDDNIFFYYKKWYVFLEFLIWNQSGRIWAVKGYFCSVQSLRTVIKVSWPGLCRIIKTKLQINKSDKQLHPTQPLLQVVISNCNLFIQNVLGLGSITTIFIVWVFFFNQGVIDIQHYVLRFPVSWCQEVNRSDAKKWQMS